MSPEKQRIAIAEACGWLWCLGLPKKNPWVKGWRNDNPPYRTADHWQALPDYLKDRNAMHEAFLSLDDVQKEQCLSFLYEAARHNHADKDIALAKATLQQWSYAILSALNKWGDS